MTKAGWVLIIVGLALIVTKTALDYWILLKAKTDEGGSQRGLLNSVTLPDLSALAELLKAPHGAGIALVISGAVLLLAASGVDVSFGGSVGTPTPTPT
jgi:hypothetical protein